MIISVITLQGATLPRSDSQRSQRPLTDWDLNLKGCTWNRYPSQTTINCHRYWMILWKDWRGLGLTHIRDF